jgi:3-oxoadipate enol-lactonase
MSAGALACHVSGPANGPAIVLLHALATHSDLWQPQLAAWSLAWRVIRIDLPGHGASPAPTGPMTLADHAACVVGALDALEIEQAAVVGLSLGGMVAQSLALAYPRRVRALVLAHTSARTEAPGREIWERRLEQFERDGLAAQVEPTLERWFTPTFTRDSPMTLHWVAQQIRATSDAGYATAIRAIQALDHLDQLARIAQPTLVVAGDLDVAVPVAAASAMAERMPHAEFVVLRDAGHLGNVQQPLRFTETVGAFLKAALA